MKKIIAVALAALLALSTAAALADTITIAVPNDPTNEGRALLLLQAYGYIKLDPNAGEVSRPPLRRPRPYGGSSHSCLCSCEWSGKSQLTSIHISQE